MINTCDKVIKLSIEKLKKHDNINSWLYYNGNCHFGFFFCCRGKVLQKEDPSTKVAKASEGGYLSTGQMFISSTSV